MQVWTTREVLEAARHDTAQVIKALNGLFSSLPGAKILNSPGAVTIKQRVQGGQFLMKLEHDHLKLWYEAGDPLSGLSGADLQDIGVVPGMVGQVRRLTSVEGLEDLELPDDVKERLRFQYRQLTVRFSQEPPAFEHLFEDTDRLLALLAELGDDPLPPLDAVQERVVRLAPGGNVVVRGVAGSGKTSVLLHRIRRLLSGRSSREASSVLLLTHNRSLATAAREILVALALEPVEVQTIHRWCMMYVNRDAAAAVMLGNNQPKMLEAAVSVVEREVPGSLLWVNPVSFWQDEIHYIKGRVLGGRQEYMRLPRHGASHPLPREQRELVWRVYEAYVDAAKGRLDWDDLISRAHGRLIHEGDYAPRYDFVFVDEAQDLTMMALRVAAFLARDPGELFTAFDAAQGIFERGFRFKDAGIKVHGDRSFAFTRNYRNTRAILDLARPVLAAVHREHQASAGGAADLVEPKAAVWEGAAPRRLLCEAKGEGQAISDEIARLLATGRYRPEQMAVLAYPHHLLKVIQAKVEAAGIPCQRDHLRSQIRRGDPSVKVMPMKSAKGLEFPVVFVVATDSCFQPPRAARKKRHIEAHHADMRRMFYVALTRAMSELILVHPEADPPRLLEGADDEQRTLAQLLRERKTSWVGLLEQLGLPDDIGVTMKMTLGEARALLSESGEAQRAEAEAMPAPRFFPTAQGDELRQRGGYYIMPVTSRYGRVTGSIGLGNDRNMDLVVQALEVSCVLTTGTIGFVPGQSTLGSLQIGFDGTLPEQGDVIVWLDITCVGVHPITLKVQLDPIRPESRRPDPAVVEAPPTAPQTPGPSLEEESARSVSTTSRALLPYPLARLFNLYRVSPTAHQKHGDAINLAQGIFRYLSLVCLADAIALGASDKQAKRWLRQDLKSPGPGKYLWVLKETEAFLSAQGGAFLSEVHDLVQNDWEPLVEEIVGDRNELAHENIALTQGQAKQRLETLGPRLDRLLARVQFLQHYLLGTCYESEEVEPGRWRSQWIGCRGGEEVCEPQPLYTPGRLQPDAVLLLDPRRNRSLVVSPVFWRADVERYQQMYWLTRLDTSTPQQTKAVFGHPVLKQRCTRLLPRVYGRDDEGVTVEEFLEARAHWCRRMDLLLEERSRKQLSDLEPPAGFADLEFVGVIGSGSMGKVWEVRHRTLDRLEALKLLHRHHATDVSYSKRFRREGKTIQRLRHPRIVEVIDMNQTADGQAYIRMGLIRGQSLNQHILRQGGIGLDEALTYTDQLLDVLEHVHARKVVHRDIKPSNIMLDAAGVRLIDFGIAKLDQGTRYTSGTVMGTDNYMAPEQRDGEASPRSDLYAVGRTLFAMLAARAPKISRPEIPSEVVPGVPGTVDELYAKATQPFEADRFQSAAEMRRYVALVLQGAE